ncbi:14410_t:CDS:2, partial [Rhizophagus irregularis]
KNKSEVNRIVEEIYLKIQYTINPIDASDRVLVAIIKALISLNNDPSSPRQLAACIQKYVSGHISTHFSRVRNQVVPNPIIVKQPHPTIAKRSLYYFLDPDNILRELLKEYFSIDENLQTQITSSSPVKSESDVSIINGNQYCAETPPSTPSSMKDIEEDDDDVINKPISDSDNAETRFVE